jgi:uncharacterized metal-binding protein YceD (DUF177 family)
MSERRSRSIEFSRPVAIESIGPRAQVRKIDAGEEERRGLAERFGLVALHSLSASLALSRPAGEVIHAKGHLVADVVQSCVVTLEPVPAHIEADFACSYTGGAPMAGDLDLDPLAEEEVESLLGEEIDLGETVAQQLAIALDPYPRAPGAAWPEDGQAEPGVAQEGRKKPFAALEKLKKP